MMKGNKVCRIQISPGFYLQCALLFLLLPVQWVLALGISAAVHELGHVAALRLLRVPVNAICFCPSGVILGTPPIETGKEMFCAVTGPACGLCLVLLYRWFPELALFALFHSVYNLLPMYPADGGRIFAGLCKWILPPGVEEKAARAVGAGTAFLLVCAGLYGTLFAKLGLFPAALGMGLGIRALKKQK